MKAFSQPLRLLLPAAALSAAAPAIAQSQERTGELVIVSVGGGAAFVPQFPGARDLKLRPLPLFDIRRIGTDAVFEAPDESADFALIKSDNLRIGPVIGLASGRDESDALVGIGDVGTTVEAGAFAEAYVTPKTRVRGEVRKGFGGHEGLVADLGADMIMGSLEKGAHYSFGPRLRLADAKYMRAFYGVDAGQSARTGLAFHDPSGGAHSAGAVATANYRINERWGIESYARYDRLLGDAADSPLVRSAVGSRNQFEFGLGATYSFRL